MTSATTITELRSTLLQVPWRGDPPPGAVPCLFMSTPAPAENALIKTTYGDMEIAFWPDVAPKTVENFKKLANEKFYDGTAFHRIIKGSLTRSLKQAA